MILKKSINQYKERSVSAGLFCFLSEGGAKVSVFYTYKKNDMESEKMDFLRLLYHDRRGGQMIRLKKIGSLVEQYSTCDLQELAATGTDVNVYTTVNTFRGKKRSADKLFNYCSIFIDLDCHSLNPDKIQISKERAKKILEKSYASNELAAPTLITDTGRGFGIQYVLAKSIANVPSNEKQRQLYKTIRRRILEKYQEILSVDPEAAQPDPTAIDDSRVCRIPGTYNMSAGCYCRLIYASNTYYELDALVKENHLWTWISDDEYRKNQKKKPKKSNIVDINTYRLPFLAARIEQLQKLQDLRGKKCTDACREQLLFVAYSALVQLNYDQAAERLQQLNLRFCDPLPQGEVDHIIEETDAVVGYRNKGYYNLSDRYIIETLNLTKEEISAIGIGAGLKRTAERELARQKKREQKEKVIELLVQVDRLTYEEIAEATGISRRTVCNIAKMEGVSRHKRNTDSGNIKSAKNAVKSVCGGSDMFSLDLLSTAGVGVTGEEGSVDWYMLLFSDAFNGISPANQLLGLFNWSSSFSDGFGALVEEFFDNKTHILFDMKNIDRISAEKHLLKELAHLFIDKNGIDECKIIFQDQLKEYPILWDLCQKKSHKKSRKQRKKAVNWDAETPDQKVIRIDGYLQKYKDQRFEIIESTDEYIQKIDGNVLKIVKTAFMQVKRLKRDTWNVSGQTIAVSDLKQCFECMTYKDIVVICQRMQNQGTLQHAKTPFYYVVQTVWKHKNNDVTQAQSGRTPAKKPEKTGFNNFSGRKNNYEFLEANLIRKSMGMPLLTLEQWQEQKKNGS